MTRRFRRPGTRQIEPDGPFTMCSEKFMYQKIYEILDKTEDSIGYSRTDMWFLMNFLKNKINKQDTKDPFEGAI